ncbi:MAG: response regulator [Gammaproteobacteria bacterium]|nr:response regulator [Gammaproteobacteria bacterium]
MIVSHVTKTNILSTEVEDTISDLVSLASKLLPEIDSSSVFFDEYIALLKKIHEQTDGNIFIYLDKLISILIEGIQLLQISNRLITHHELSFIKNFPQILEDYLQLPESKIPATILIKHFNDSTWIRPLTREEQAMLMSYIHNQHTSHDEVVSDGNEVLEKILKSGEENNGDNNAEVMEESTVSAINTDDDLLNQDIELSLDDFIVTSDLAQNSTKSSNVSDLEIVAELIEDNAENYKDVVYAKENNTQEQHIDPQQQELIDLVCCELQEIIENIDDIDKLSGEELYQNLVVLAEQVENIGNAVDLIGLKGLSKVSAFISKNLNNCTEKIEQFTNNVSNLIKKWPSCCLGYLKNLYNIEQANKVLDIVRNKNWPINLSELEIDDINCNLSNPSLVKEEKVQRQTTATLEDVSIILPDDVNHDLLEGLLQDLPAQTEEFSETVQRLQIGGALEDIDVAQRIAHTLKGAANVVGVKGIANLTHHLEDILEAQSKAKKLPIKPLVEVLISASDCLESMSDALLGIDDPPSDSVFVMQKILDWANKLDMEGVSKNPAEHEGSHQIQQVNLSLVEAVNVDESTNSKESIIAENMLRIPVRLADELLRLAGENLISTGQIQERIKNIIIRQEALYLQNQSLQKISFDLEHLIDIQGVSSSVNVGPDNDEFDPLEMDKYNELHSVSRRLVEAAADSAGMAQVLDEQLTELQNLVITQKQVQKENQEIVLRTRMVPVKNIIPRLKRGVRQACRLTNKNVDLQVEDNDTYMDSDVLSNLIEPLMHVLRNAIDHGIEESEERIARGKVDSGFVKVKFERVGDQVAINVEDDGRGMSQSNIRDAAIKKGLIKPEQELADDVITRLILEPGFTTKNEVTQISGRGVGLDVVNVALRELKGSINIYSEENKGSRFEISLPISSFSTHSLLVRVRNNIYALSNRGIEEILYPGLGELCEIGDEIVFQVGDDAYAAIDFDNLLNLPIDRRNLSRTTKPVVIVKNESGNKTAILIQEVLDSTDVVVKKMGQYIPKLKGIVGATILGDGSVSPVIDLPELLQEQQSNNKPRNCYEVNETIIAKNNIPYVLVVDDSLSARRSLSQFVQDLGLDVRTARDGMEAVSLIDSRKPDLLLVDMEMPKMNGLELTSHIRSIEHMNKIPIIMITSRSTKKHKQTAFDKGVNYFMVKPYAEEELAEQINTVLKIA